MLLTAAVFALVGTAPALAEHTRWWRQATFEDFDKGTAKGVALPKRRQNVSGAEVHTEIRGCQPRVPLANSRRLQGKSLRGRRLKRRRFLRIDASGKSSSVFESSELAAQALALDASGNLFVGTSPDGKVYKVSPAGQSSVFFDPKTKYIWDLAVDKGRRNALRRHGRHRKNLLGRARRQGPGFLFQRRDQYPLAGARWQGERAGRNGAERAGPLRIPKAAANRHAFVLYETSKKEITSLLQSASGDLYVSAVGEKTAPSPGQPRPITTENTTTTSNFVITLGPAGNTAAPVAQSTQPFPFTPLATVNSSSVYRIASDGSPEELWSARDEVVYSMGLLPDGKLLLGTGNDGTVLELEGDHIYSKLVKAASRQVTSIAAGPGGKLFLAAANPGKVYSLGPENESEGTYESQAFDAHIFSRWGRTVWLGENIPSGGKSGAPGVAIYARSGNTSDPDSNWSDWAGPYTNPAGDKLECPASRFVLGKAVLRGGGSGPAKAPAINWFSIAYLPKNIAPQVTAIALQDSGVRLQNISLPSMSSGQQNPVQLRMPQPRLHSASSANVILHDHHDFRYDGAIVRFVAF